MSNKTIKAKEILADMKAGFNDLALMQKYQVSYSQLQSLFKKMVEAGVLLQMEVDQRLKSVEKKTEDNQAQVNEAQNLPVPSTEIAETNQQEQEQSDKKPSGKDAAIGCAILSFIIFILVVIVLWITKSIPTLIEFIINKISILTEFFIAGIIILAVILFNIVIFGELIQFFIGLLKIFKGFISLLGFLIQCILKLLVFLFSIGILALVIWIGVQVGGNIGGVITFLFLIVLGWWGQRKSKSKTMNDVSNQNVSEEIISDKKN